jgi:hypothetical protein
VKKQKNEEYTHTHEHEGRRKGRMISLSVRNVRAERTCTLGRRTPRYHCPGDGGESLRIGREREERREREREIDRQTERKREREGRRERDDSVGKEMRGRQ